MKKSTVYLCREYNERTRSGDYELFLDEKKAMEWLESAKMGAIDCLYSKVESDDEIEIYGESIEVEWDETEKSAPDYEDVEEAENKGAQRKEIFEYDNWKDWETRDGTEGTILANCFRCGHSSIEFYDEDSCRKAILAAFGNKRELCEGVRDVAVNLKEGTYYAMHGNNHIHISYTYDGERKEENALFVSAN